MCGDKTKSGKVIYRCLTAGKKGEKACHYYQIREEEILPFVLVELRKEIDDILDRLFPPPCGSL